MSRSWTEVSITPTVASPDPDRLDRFQVVDRDRTVISDVHPDTLGIVFR